MFVAQNPVKQQADGVGYHATQIHEGLHEPSCMCPHRQPMTGAHSLGDDLTCRGISEVASGDCIIIHKSKQMTPPLQATWRKATLMAHQASGQYRALPNTRTTLTLMMMAVIGSASLSRKMGSVCRAGAQPHIEWRRDWGVQNEHRSGTARPDN